MVTGAVKQEGAASIGEINVDDGSPGTNSLRVMGAGIASFVAVNAGANSVRVGVNDLSSYKVATFTESSAGQGSRPVGSATIVTTDNVAIALAIREAPLPIPKSSVAALAAVGAFPGGQSTRI